MDYEYTSVFSIISDTRTPSLSDGLLRLENSDTDYVTPLGRVAYMTSNRASYS